DLLRALGVILIILRIAKAARGQEGEQEGEAGECSGHALAPGDETPYPTPAPREVKARPEPLCPPRRSTSPHCETASPPRPPAPSSPRSSSSATPGWGRSLSTSPTSIASRWGWRATS